MENLDLEAHYRAWNKEVREAAEKAAEDVQDDMYGKVVDATPVRIYPTKSGVVNHISKRAGNGVKAVRVKAPDYEQPGAMKAGWVKAKLKLGGNEVYAVRNRNQPTVVHLVNFPTDHYSHGKRTGIITGNKQFVSKAQEQGMYELNKRIEKIFEKGGGS